MSKGPVFKDDGLAALPVFLSVRNPAEPLKHALDLVRSAHVALRARAASVESALACRRAEHEPHKASLARLEREALLRLLAELGVEQPDQHSHAAPELGVERVVDAGVGLADFMKVVEQGVDLLVEEDGLLSLQSSSPRRFLITSST